jgi:hypothetical protein
MQRSLILVAVAAVLFAAAWLRADDAYPIKARNVAEGDVCRIQKTETATVATKVVNPVGVALVDQTQKTTATAVYAETILKCEAKKAPTKVERKYEKAQLTVEGKTTDLAYSGKTVVIEKKDGKYSFTVDGKELSDADAQTLAKEFERDGGDKNDFEKAMLPRDPVKLNESWKVDMGPVVKYIGKGGEMELDADKAKGTGTLLKAYKKDDTQFGELKLVLTLPIKSLGKGNMKMVAEAGASATTELNMDGCIDGTANAGTFKGGMKLDAEGSVPDGQGGKLSVTISVHSKFEETRKDLTKDGARK